MSVSPNVTVEEAAELLHCGRSRVFELLADGRLQRGPKFGRQTVITRESVEALARGEETEKPKRRRQRVSRSAKQLADLIRSS